MRENNVPSTGFELLELAGRVDASRKGKDSILSMGISEAQPPFVGVARRRLRHGNDILEMMTHPHTQDLEHLQQTYQKSASSKTLNIPKLIVHLLGCCAVLIRKAERVKAKVLA
jgi:hypothetical protein